MPRWVNILTQVLLLVAQMSNQFFDVLKLQADYRTAIMLALGFVQALIGIVAHEYNPDGTPAVTAYVPPGTIAKILPLILVALILPGCATGMGVTGMSASQLTEFAKIKDSTLTCVKGMYAGVTIVATFVNVDKGIPAGAVVKDSCEITFTVPAPVK